MDYPELKSKTIAGISWTFLAQASIQLLSFVVAVILARLLSPADFGLVGQVAIFTGFARLIMKMGLGQALIQKSDLDDESIQSAFWINVALGLGLSLITVLISPLISMFYNESRLTALMSALSITFVIGSLNIINLSRLRKNLEFKSFGIIQVTGEIAGSITGITFALLGFGVWSLVFQSIAGEVGNVLATWAISPWKPKFIFHFQKVKPLLRYALHISGYSILDYWVRNSDNLIVGKLLGPLPLGYYARSYSLMLLPVSQITSVIGQVMFPSLSMLKDDLDKVRAVYIRATSLIAMVSFPMMIGLLVTADLFVNILLGEKWLPVVPSLRYFCLAGLILSVSSTAAWIFQSQNFVSTMLRIQLVKSPLMVLGFLIGAYRGNIERVAVIFLSITLIFAIVEMIIAGKIIRLKTHDLLRSLLKTLLNSIVMGLAVIAMRYFLAAHIGNLAPEFIISLAIGAIVYGFLFFSFEKQNFNQLVGILRSAVGRG
jgi:PST family polysaccharide transporter